VSAPSHALCSRLFSLRLLPLQQKWAQRAHFVQQVKMVKEV
jgi:hypothetical protein